MKRRASGAPSAILIFRVGVHKQLARGTRLRWNDRFSRLRDSPWRFELTFLGRSSTPVICSNGLGTRRLRIHRLTAFVGDLRVDLSRAEARVAEQVLNVGDIPAGLGKVCRDGVPEDVRVLQLGRNLGRVRVQSERGTVGCRRCGPETASDQGPLAQPGHLSDCLNRFGLLSGRSRRSATVMSRHRSVGSTSSATAR